ncbi:SH3 domain-containing protein [Bradyrhizobium sp. JYMT SZCCT0180]|uniref:SH3 domain-containing protein n=1 Tax=Bradyrhizobium sp. JYMT SZCCT0180 TaxID=2807666 RepID=UPI001BAC7F7C|nr:SH3 domain-containing protein [Bradyrhizobium sp. JYMT SZCCT0180]MBR1212340.1 SH3 domain-containing protein [Bradyrhizobium sp. JYMT SZCCT0180]
MQKTALLSIAVVAFLVTAAIAQSEPEPAWRASALALVPAGYVAGEAYRTTEMTGYLAVYPAGANDPKSPASVFAARQVLVVKLDKDGRALSAELKPRSDATRGNRDTTMTDPDGQESEFAKSHAELAAKRATLPDGTEPCSLGAWSEDRDPKGLNVRAEPSVKSRVLGTLPPPYRLKMGGSENTPEDGWLTEFRIIGFKDGWFLIEGATPPGKEYEDEKKYPRNAPKPYAGRGWVAASKVGANYANGGTRMGGLFQAPFADAKWTQAQRKLGGTLDTDGGPKRLLACSGYWGLVESQDGVRGWWRSLCSSQVTNCS